MSITTLLDKLESVKRVRADKWQARCPAHDDKNPSLSIKETSDGTVLVKCWAGCGAHDIVSSVGLTMQDLFPECPTNHHKRPQKRPFSAMEILSAIRVELIVIHLAAQDIYNGHELAAADHERLGVSINRVQQAINYAEGHR